MEHILNNIPEGRIEYYSSEQGNFIIPNLKNREIRKNFVKELFEGLSNSLKGADSYWKDASSFFCTSNGLNTLRHNSDLCFQFLDFRNPFILQTPLIGWISNGWEEENTGKENYSAFFAGRNDLLKIQEVEDVGVVASIRKCHTLPFDANFIEETIRKYSGQKIGKNVFN